MTKRTRPSNFWIGFTNFLGACGLIVLWCVLALLVLAFINRV